MLQSLSRESGYIVLPRRLSMLIKKVGRVNVIMVISPMVSPPKPYKVE